MSSERSKLIGNLTGSRPGFQASEIVSVEDDASTIRILHDGILAQFTNAIKNAIAIGEILTRKKSELKHGEFTPWIEANLPFTDRHARTYMRVFENRELLKRKSISDLKSAMALLSDGGQSDIPTDQESPGKIYRKFQTGEKLSKPEKEVLRPWLSDQLKTAQNKAKKLKADLENL